MQYGPSGCSIPAEAAWWFDRQQLGEVEFDDRSQSFRHDAVLLVVGQAFEPRGIPGLQVGEFGARIVPSLAQAAPIGRAADADHRRASHARGAVARPRLRRGRLWRSASVMAVSPIVGRGMVPTPKRYVTKPRRPARAGTPHRSSSSPRRYGPSCWLSLSCEGARGFAHLVAVSFQALCHGGSRGTAPCPALR